MKTTGSQRSKKSFLIRYFIFILLPLGVLICFLCHRQGIVKEHGKVKVISTFSFLKQNISSGSGLRGGGTSNSVGSIKMQYQVMCKTKDDKICHIHVSTYTDFAKFKSGMEVETEYTIKKEKGIWRLTQIGEFVLKIWLMAFLVMMFVYLLKT